MHQNADFSGAPGSGEAAAAHGGRRGADGGGAAGSIGPRALAIRQRRVPMADTDLQ